MLNLTEDLEQCFEIETNHPPSVKLNYNMLHKAMNMLTQSHLVYDGTVMGTCLVIHAPATINKFQLLIGHQILHLYTRKTGEKNNQKIKPKKITHACFYVHVCMLYVHVCVCLYVHVCMLVCECVMLVCECVMLV